jgi:predicted permease
MLPGELWRRLHHLLFRRRFEDDLAEEMRLHLELRAAAQAADGMPREDAQAAAHRRFGNSALLREQSREAWGWTQMEALLQDLRYGLRSLVANKGFTAIALLSLALGIGANTAMFTILNAVMLRSLPVEDPARLVKLQMSGNEFFTNPIWEQIRDRETPFSHAFAYGNDRFDLSAGGESHFARSLWVSGEYFKTLGVPAYLGRVLSTENDHRNCGSSGPVAVVSYAFWQSYFSGKPEVLGKRLTLNRKSFQIVGVTPPWFKGLDIDQPFEIAIPLGCEPVLHTDRSALDERSWWWLRVLGRLKDGESLEHANSRLKTLSLSLFQATLPANYEPSAKQRYLASVLASERASTGFSNTGSRYRKGLITVMAVVALVLLIACANIANLLLARGTARSREISVRLAIGARRSRVIRQLLTESLLLAFIGACMGALLAYWGSGLLVRLLSTSRESIALDLMPDLHVLGFTIFVCVATGLLFGLAPAIRATSISPNRALKEGSKNLQQGNRFGLARALVTLQVALSLVLVVGACLFLGTLHNLLTVDTGFNADRVMYATVGVQQAGVLAPQRTPVYASMLDRIRAIPGIESAAECMITPLSGMGWNDDVEPEGFEDADRSNREVFFNRVSPQFFDTMRTPLLVGRDFGDRDTLHAVPVIIISESAAKRFFGARNAIGRTIRARGERDAKINYTIIGVVRDTKYLELNEKTRLTAYLPRAQDPDPFLMTNFVVRSNLAPEVLTPAIRNAITSVNHGVAIEFHSLATQAYDSLVESRLVALLSAFFAGLALLLAMIGLYGVTAYSVVRRRGEIGIRVALGAQRQQVIWLVLKEVALMLVIGLFVGLAASAAAGRLVRSLLFGVSPAEPALIALAAGILAVATTLAGYLPARRAAALDPMVALREE